MIDLQNLTKTVEGRKKIIKWAGTNLTPSFNRQDDDENWQYYNNDFPKSKFDYLRKYGDFVLPVQVRHYPIQRPYVNYLSSRQTRRPMLFKARITDKKSKMEKRLFFIRQIMEQIEMQMVQVSIQEQWRLQQVGTQIQQIQQLAQQEPQDQQQASQIQQAKQILPQLELQFQLLQVESNKTSEKYKKIIDHVSSNREKDIVDYIQEKASKQLKNAIKDLKIKDKSVQNFIREIVTGKQYYYVDFINGKKVFRTIDSNSVFYSKEANADWTQDCEMAGFTEKMSLSQVINEFKLTNNEIQQIKNDYPAGYQDDSYFVATPGANAVYVSNGVDPSDEGEGYEVKRVWWIYEKEIKYIKSPNKHTGGYFHRFVKDDDNIINEDDYRYDKKSRKWINKENQELSYNDREVHRINNSKGQKLERRYISLRYKGVIIGNKIIREEEDTIQLHKNDDKTFNKLPIIGPTFNSRTDTPYSYIDATKGLQEFYNLLGFHEELMLATSGTKTLLFDMVQKPNNMSEKEWMYNVKIGFAKLESYKKKIGRVAFNQFQEVDLSLSSSIQYINNIKIGIEEQMGRIFGISRQAMGVTVNSDQVGTFELSQQSALLITEILFYRHDMILLEALTILCAILTKYDNKHEDYVEDDNGFIDVIPAGYFTGRDFDLKAENNAKEEQDLVNLKQLALSYAAKGQYRLSEMVRLYNIENLNEFQRELDKLDKKAMELQSQIQSQNEEKGEELRAKMIELENQYKMAMEKEKNRLKEIELQMKQEDARNKFALDREKILEEKENNRTEAQLKGIELANEQAMEAAVLEENKEARTMDNRLSLLEMQLNTIVNKLNINLQKDKQDKDYEANIKKVDVDKQKARKMVKEHTSDK